MVYFTVLGTFTAPNPVEQAVALFLTADHIELHEEKVFLLSVALLPVLCRVPARRAHLRPRLDAAAVLAARFISSRRSSIWASRPSGLSVKVSSTS
jgi:hypothetical protein